MDWFLYDRDMQSTLEHFMVLYVEHFMVLCNKIILNQGVMC